MSTRKIAAAVAATAALAVGAFALAGPAQASTATAHKNIATARPASGAAHSGKTPARALAPAVASAKPAGYKVVHSGSLVAAANTQTHGTIACPSGKVPWGGGVFSSSGTTLFNVNSSYPTTTGWSADVNNASTSASSFIVYAICAKKPPKYNTVTSAVTTVNAGTQISNITTTCVNGRAMSGGFFSDSTSLLANGNSSIPTKTGWRVDANNASTGVEHVTAYTLCGTVSNYKIITGTAVSNPAGTQTGAAAACPSGAVPLGGGAFSSSGSTSVSINTSYPLTTGWQIYENNGSTSAASVTPYAVCTH